MSGFFTAYMTVWGLAVLAALWLLVRNARRIMLFSERYRAFLFVRWKVVTFVAAAAGLIAIAPYTGDVTWDYVDAAFMSALAFLTAPWAVGVIYRAARGRSSLAETYCAVCVWLFSASWSYDLYLLLKSESYPVTWLANLFASSVLYIAAGMMWNLEWRQGRGVIFGFMADDWPNPSTQGGFGKIFWMALPLMALAAAMILPFLF